MGDAVGKREDGKAYETARKRLLLINTNALHMYS